jgi:hypothetical protein
MSDRSKGFIRMLSMIDRSAIAGWLLFSRRRKRAKEQNTPEADDKGT